MKKPPIIRFKIKGTDRTDTFKRFCDPKNPFDTGYKNNDVVSTGNDYYRAEDIEFLEPEQEKRVWGVDPV